MPTALLSVYDKSGIVELASALDDAGWTLVSSGGTAAAVAAAGVPVTDVADITGVPAILDHRVVTLHPRIHGGILADPTKASHQIDMAQYGISAIDLVVVRRFRRSPRLVLTVATIGVSQLLVVAATLLPRWWGKHIFAAPTMPARRMPPPKSAGPQASRSPTGPYGLAGAKSGPTSMT